MSRTITPNLAGTVLVAAMCLQNFWMMQDQDQALKYKPP